MENALSVVTILIGFLLVYRGYLFYKLKFKLRYPDKRYPIRDFLVNGFGNINTLFIWYLPVSEISEPYKKLVKTINILTTISVVTSIAIPVLFVLVFFSK